MAGVSGRTGMEEPGCGPLMTADYGGKSRRLSDRASGISRGDGMEWQGGVAKTKCTVKGEFLFWEKC